MRIGSGYKYVSNEYPTTLVKSTFMCCSCMPWFFLTPPPPFHRLSKPCSLWVFNSKSKTNKTKAKLHARAREELLHLSSLREVKEGRLLCHYLTWSYTTLHHTVGWTYTHKCMQIFTFADRCLVVPCLWSFANFNFNLQIRLAARKAEGKWSPDSALVRSIGSEYSHDSTASRQGFVIILR